jgi:para-nitrobenzyl esterase
VRRLLSALFCMFIASVAGAQTVWVDSGMLEGKTLTSGVRAWLGVPFAAPPVRDLRWRAPKPAPTWEGIYHADRFAPMCLQPGRGRTINHYFGTEATSEDCLYLNIWSPPAGNRLPVLVWIYGGAFNVGSASMANYSGEGLAQKGVVRVNIAYRVGPMGFLAHPDLTKEGDGHSGNYGLMDQIAALQWIKRNIATFGGDPDNVTIMGQSAGSMSVSLLQIDPHAKGLFHKIVGMSGSAHGGDMGPVPLAQGEAAGIKLQKALGARGIEDMRDLAGDRVLAAFQNDPSAALVMDGAHLTGSAAEVFAAGQQSDVPIMVGYTRDERFANLGSLRTVAEYRKAIETAFLTQSSAVMQAYPAKNDADVARASVDLLRDMSVGRQMFLWALRTRQVGKAPAYGYFFTRRQPYTAGITFSDHDPATVGAYHTGDVPFFLRTLNSLNLFRRTRDWTAEDVALSDTMSAAIINFARTGSPGPGWPTFDVKRPRLMRLGFDGGVIGWPNANIMPMLTGATPEPVAPAPARVRD